MSRPIRPKPAITRNLDTFAKIPKTYSFVIAAKTGIQCLHLVLPHRTSVYIGVTTIHETINHGQRQNRIPEYYQRQPQRDEGFIVCFFICGYPCTSVATKAL
jgi:hypothetical protein